MVRVLVWLFRIAVGLIVLTIVGAAAAYVFVSRSLPDYDARLTVNGLSAEVEIVRDSANVPHVFAESDADAFFGLGYAHAQDRLWQMLLLRRTVQGRMSEAFGARTLGFDRLFRRLDLYRLAQESLDAQDADVREALRAYAAGVNARLAEINDRALGRGAPELVLFNMTIAPWRPADSLAVLKLLAVQLAVHLPEEVLHARVSAKLDDAARLADIMPLAPGDGGAEIPQFAQLSPGSGRPALLAGAPGAEDPLSPLRGRGFGGASNAWAAGPERTVSGGTLLANDPHLRLSAPSIWYLARLELESGGVIGGTVPGVPAIVVGRSDRLAWGLTYAYVDDQDLHIERLNPDSPGEYLTPDGYKPFEVRRSIISVKGAEPQTITLRWTENGPVLPAEHFNLGAVTPPGHVMSLSWTALTPEDTTLSAGMRIMRAGSVREAIAAGRLFVAPAQNLMLADRERIAMKVVGAIPRRDPGHRTLGRAPSEGWRAENRWLGIADYAQNPEFHTPQSGILGNTNNKTVDRPFPSHLTFAWGDTQRISRLEELMERNPVHTVETFADAQLDSVSYTARSLLSLIARRSWFAGQAAQEGTPQRRRQKALEMLGKWNGEMSEHRPEPLIYAAWMRALMKRLVQDELGRLADSFRHVEPIFVERVYRDVNGASAWCDVKGTVDRETCEQIAAAALDDALLWLDETYGGRIESLRWGSAHMAAHDHQALGRAPVLGFLLNIRQSSSGGDNTLMRGRTSGRDPEPFLNVHGAGYRGVYDLADPNASRFVISTGQSGHFLSDHYDDMAQLWRRGDYVTMSLDPALARAAAVGITVLEPGGE